MTPRGRRLSDTEALTDREASATDHSVSVRQIANGYMIRRSSYNERTGDSYSVEEYSATAPKVTPPGVRGRMTIDGVNSLSGGVKEANGG